MVSRLRLVLGLAVLLVPWSALTHENRPVLVEARLQAADDPPAGGAPAAKDSGTEGKKDEPVADGQDGKNGQQPANPMGIWFTILPIMVIFYFLMIRAPMKKQERERQSLLSALKKNDKLLTSCGIIGIVA